MPLEIIMHVQELQWKKSLRPYCKTITAICNATFDATKLAHIDADWSLAVVLTNDAALQTLNHDFRSKDMPTNVLSFPAEERIEARAKSLAKAGMTELGDVILAYETIAKEAKEQGKTFKAHTQHLLVHGMLHLLGYDHMQPEQAKKMENKEIKILKSHDIPNPYL